MQQAGKRCCDAKCNDVDGAVQEEFCEKIIIRQDIVLNRFSMKPGPVAALQQPA
jgi:hypothetical protein